MKTVINQLFAIILLLGVAPIVSATESSDQDGSDFTAKLEACGACHGKLGDAPIMPEYPVLAGQHQSYLANALRQYRDGQRTNPIMSMQLEILELTDDDIDALASYFSGQQSRLHGLAE